MGIMRATIIHILLLCVICKSSNEVVYRRRSAAVNAAEGLFTCCIDRGVGACQGFECVAHSNIIQGLLEVFLTAWLPHLRQLVRQ